MIDFLAILPLFLRRDISQISLKSLFSLITDYDYSSFFRKCALRKKGERESYIYIYKYKNIINAYLLFCAISVK